MSLVPDYGDSSTSSTSDSDTDSELENTSKKETTKNRLPVPNFGEPNIPKEMEEVSKVSVFTNPYIEAENAKEAILQKHVKMVDTKDNVIVINGKKICWNYRKGKCRFGHKCQYAHDSDIQKTDQQIQEEKIAALNCPNAVVCDSYQSGINRKYVKKDESGKHRIGFDDESVGNKRQKNKRPGLSQGLVPGKKVMKQYMNQKN